MSQKFLLDGSKLDLSLFLMRPMNNLLPKKNTFRMNVDRKQFVYKVVFYDSHFFLFSLFQVIEIK